MSVSDLDARVRAADPVPAREPSPLSAADERLLSSILATPRRRRRAVVARVAMPLAAAAAVAAVVAVVVAHRPTEVSPGTSGALPVPPGGIIHILVQQYSGTTSGRTVPDGRIEGWAQPSTGRARIVDRAQNGGLREQIVVDGNDRVTRWLGAGSPQLTVQRSPSLARSDRRLVTDRIDEREREDYVGFMPATAVRHFRRTLHTRYAGRPAVEREAVVVVRLGTPNGLRDHGFFARTFRDARTGAPLGYERGDCDPDGSHARVMIAERVLVHEALTAASAARELDWRPTPGPAATPTPAP